MRQTLWEPRAVVWQLTPPPAPPPYPVMGTTSLDQLSGAPLLVTNHARTTVPHEIDLSQDVEDAETVVDDDDAVTQPFDLDTQPMEDMTMPAGTPAPLLLGGRQPVQLLTPHTTTSPHRRTTRVPASRKPPAGASIERPADASGSHSTVPHCHVPVTCASYRITPRTQRLCSG